MIYKNEGNQWKSKSRWPRREPCALSPPVPRHRVPSETTGCYQGEGARSVHRLEGTPRSRCEPQILLNAALHSSAFAAMAKWVFPCQRATATSLMLRETARGFLRCSMVADENPKIPLQG